MLELSGCEPGQKTLSFFEERNIPIDPYIYIYIYIYTHNVLIVYRVNVFLTSWLCCWLEGFFSIVSL